VKIFLLYTAARAGIFLACWGAIWLVIGWKVEWDSVNALSTALVALVISSVIALTRLRGLRERFAADVAVRAERAAAAFNARRAAEDEDGVAALGDDTDLLGPGATRSTAGGDREPRGEA
jgi:hypothetical protein